MTEQPPATPADSAGLTPRPPYDPDAANRRSAKFALFIFPLLAIVAVSTTVVVMTGTNQSRRKSGAKHPAAGKQIGRVQLAPSVNTDQPLNYEQLKGKITLINFWGTWCPPCREEFPHLVQLYERYKDDPRFAFVSVVCGEEEQEDVARLTEDARRFLESERYKLPVYVDLKNATRLPMMLSLKMESFQYPTTIIADQDGIAVGVWTGYRRGDEESMDELLALLLK